MKNYEYTIILSPNLSDEEVANKVSQLVSFLQEKGGILEKQSLVGRKSLAYSIKKENEGHIAVISFLGSAETHAMLANKIKTEQGIMRFLALTRTPQKVSRKQPSFASARSHQAPLEETKGQEKITAQDIDKQLEEILGKGE
ncbi:MAG: 30S ribosomal protein S6 [Candidatus Wildermuthbacteria bacterium]|nr:30S ribosomal protein S6 [Candidatus Wildermuthbacteria bacterium]